MLSEVLGLHLHKKFGSNIYNRSFDTGCLNIYGSGSSYLLQCIVYTEMLDHPRRLFDDPTKQMSWRSELPF